MNEPKLSEEIRHKLIGMCVRLKTTEAECNACDVVADRVAALETEAHQVVKALQGDPEPLPDSYYSVAVTVRELRMDLAKSEAESAEFRAHAWSEQEELRGRLEHAEAERANLLRRIEKLNKRRAADREVVANAEMTLAKLAQVELERDEARGLLRSWQDAEVIRRELELDRTPQEIVTAEHNRRVVAEAQLAAAKQENARLRGTLRYPTTGSTRWLALPLSARKGVMMGDRWGRMAANIYTVATNYERAGAIIEIEAALDATFKAGRAEQREADAVVCDGYELPPWRREDGHEPRADRMSDPTLVADDCAAAIRAQDPRRELAQASWVRLEQLLDECKSAFDAAGLPYPARLARVLKDSQRRPELDPGATGPTSADLKNWFWDGDTIVDCDGDRIWIDEDEDDPEPRPSLAIQGQNGRTICWLDIVESLLSRRSQRLGTPPAR